MRTAALSISSLALLAAAPVSLSGLCPQPKDGEIVVCADPEPKPSPYRLPLQQAPEFGTRASVSVNRERNALLEYDAGGSGLCSSVGPGGNTGCQLKANKAAIQQHAGARDPRGAVYDAADPLR